MGNLCDRLTIIIITAKITIAEHIYEISAVMNTFGWSSIRGPIMRTVRNEKKSDANAKIAVILSVNLT